MKLKKALAALLCFALLVCCAPIALAAPDTATVTFWFSNGDELKTAFDLTVTDGTAESYGYTVAEADHTGAAIETVSAMDVLVAAHKAIYGDAFTAETATDYLIVNSSFISKAFGIETSNLGFTVNDATPHDDTFIGSGSSGYYTGYAIDTARVQDGDRVCLFMYQDTYYYADIVPVLDGTTIDAVTDEAFTFSADGYSIMYYGFGKQEDIDANTSPLKGATVEYTQDFETFTTVGTLDKNGEISVTFSDVGEYYLVVRGTADDPIMGETPVIASICTVTVTQAPDKATVTFWFSNGDELKTAFDLTVTDGTAESFGYTVAEKDHNDAAIETVSALDVVVAAHKAVYGDAFTAETATDYLVVNSSFISKAFGIETSNLGFTVNDATPHDDTFIGSGSSGYYTGYAIDTARVQDGDRVCLFMYQDTYYYADIVPVLDGTTIDAVTDEAFTFSADGYSIMYYGFGKQEDIDANTFPLEGATVEYTQDFETFTTVGTFDENGEISVTFSDVGEYYLVVRGTADDPIMGETPVIASICTVTVTQAPDKATVTFWFSNGDELKTAFDLTVTDGIAESYGYTVVETDHTGAAIDTVTVMDVLVAAHKAIYGDAFTAQTATDYLEVGSSFITKAFGLETSNLGFVINDATPHDDTFVEAYNGYTGYAVDTARVQDGDRVCLFTIQDAYWSDVLPLFDRTFVEAEAHKTFTVSVNGYSVVYYGCGTQETIDANTSPLADATVSYTQDFKTFTPAGTLNKDGKLSLKLPEVGTYYLVVRGTVDDQYMGSIPVIASFCTVDAKEPTLTDPALTFASAPEKTAYFVGETLDTQGLSLEYTDQYGETETVTEGFVCEPATITEAGTQDVTVTYEGLSVTFAITAEAVAPVSLEVVSAPTNDTFTYKKAPDFSGLTVRVLYNDGSERIENDLSKMTIQPDSDARVRRGPQTYRVTVDGVSATFEMQVRLQIWQWLILILLFGWIWY